MPLKWRGRPVYYSAMLVPLLALTLLIPHTPEPCHVIHGRAVFYSGDGQLRIWHIGTHHEFRPDDLRTPENEDVSVSWEKVFDLLAAGGRRPEVFDQNALYADFLICPTEPFRKGAVQSAKVRHIYHPHILPRARDGEQN